MKMCEAFVENGHEVILLAPKLMGLNFNIDLFDFYGVKQGFSIKFIDAAKIPKIRLFLYAFNVFKYLRTEKFDVIYGRDLKSCYLSCFLNKGKVFFEPHKPLEKYNFFDRAVLKKIVKKRHFSHLIVISNMLKKMFKSQNIMNSNKIRVAHDAANEFQSTNTPINLPKGLNVGYSGHLYAGRGIEIIIAIAKALPDINFHILGGNLEDIEHWKKIGYTKNLNFHGFVNPSIVMNYIDSFDILLAPYQNKVSIAGSDDSSAYMSPLKIFEYMSRKRPIIISDLPVLREVLNDKQAIFVHYNDVEEWKEAIVSLQDSTKREKIAMAAYDNFIHQYTWKIRAQNVIK